jgi:hypothetical protein
MMAAAGPSTNSDDDDTFFGIEINMNDVIDLSGFYCMNESDNLVQPKDEVSSKELDHIEKQVK